MNGGLLAEIQALAHDLGYTACGITAVEPFDEFRRAVEEGADRFPEAAHLYRKLNRLADPQSSAPWASSIIVCVRRYGKYEIPEGLTGHIGREYLCDWHYRECPDHDIRKKMEHALEKMGLRVRRGGVPDRWAGARSGVTRFGKNNFAYSEHGSWINLQSWLVDVDLPCGMPTLEPACPEGCRACIEACPTGALLEPFVMRWDHCIAYLTYDAPEPVAPDLWEGMGPWIYGCDVCQEVCPLNAGTWEPVEKAPWVAKIASCLTRDTLANMEEETYRAIVQPRFPYIPPENLARWHANARRALTWSKDPRPDGR